jgi:hypothetical protein
MYNLNLNAMKRILLGVLVSLFAVSVMAQTPKETVGVPQKYVIDMPVNLTVPMNYVVGQPIKQVNKMGRAITIIPTGGISANAYGLYAGGKTALWACPTLNAVSFIHRAGATPGSGFLEADISKDGGATWLGAQGPTYSPDNVVHFNARYPQAVIYNPTGNTNPDNAYVISMAATLDASNDAWGGVGYGTYKIDGTSTLQGSLTSGNGVYNLIPTAMTINSDGKVLGADACIPGALDYNDTLVFYKGAFNATTQEMEFTTQLQYFHCSDGSTLSTAEKEWPVEIKVAFHPTNPNIGYMATITHTDITLVPEEGYYPVILKTTDGGATWGAPIAIPLKNFGDLISQSFISDQELADLFSPGLPPDRADMWFRTAFDMDFVVDGNGNPHIAVAIFPGDNGRGLTSFSVYGSSDPKAMFDIWSPDGGTTWEAQMLGRLMTFRGTFVDISEDTRPQAATTADGSKVFFSWIDTDTIKFPSAVGVAPTNVLPDIFVVGFDPVNDKITPVMNVTDGTIADGAAFMGTMSQFVFGNTGSYKIPLVFQDMDPANPLGQVTFKYVHGFEILDADFKPIGIENTTAQNFSVSQNYPNPFNGFTNIDVNLLEGASVNFAVHNLMGQLVYSKDYGFVAPGAHKIEFNASLNSGIYVYTVQVGNETIVRKMTVK